MLSNRLVGGTFLAFFFGFGAAFATQQEGFLGDSARAVGEVALAARSKAREINDKHNVVERAKLAGAQALDNAKALDQEHRIVERTSSLAWSGLEQHARLCHSPSVDRARHGWHWQGHLLVGRTDQ